MSFSDDHETPFLREPEPLAATEAQAALALGRLDGALAHCPEPTMRIFAGLMLQSTLIAALRQEGHMFTASRFHAWFAGLTTLADETPRLARSPRALCDAILTELGHSSWEALASLAVRMRQTLLAPQDFLGEAAHEEANTEALGVISDARQLLETLAAEQSPLPFLALTSLHHAVGKSMRFAPGERISEPITMAGRRFLIERAPVPSPRWAIELAYGEQWRAAGILHYALPCPGLIRLDALRHDPEDIDAAPIIRAAALRDLAQLLLGKLTTAAALAARIEERMQAKRSTSRAPALCELLAGFGAMRSAQIEAVLGATRLGVRSMLAALGKLDILEHALVSGTHLYSVRLTDRPSLEPTADDASFAFSNDALAEYNASMANIDQLLARSGASLDDADDQRVTPFERPPVPSHNGNGREMAQNTDLYEKH